MDELLRWLLLNAGQLSVAGVLASLLVVGAFALQRGWVVPGWMYDECTADRDRFEAKVEATNKSNEEKLAYVNSELALLKDELRRRR